MALDFRGIHILHNSGMHIKEKVISSRKMVRQYTVVLAALFFVCISCNFSKNVVVVSINPPTAEKKPFKYTEFGNQRIDNYEWLKNRKDSNVMKLLLSENEYANKMLSHTEGLRQRLLDELVLRSKSTFSSPPLKSRGYWYYSRLERGREYPIHYRRKGSMKAVEELVLDINKMAKGYTVFKTPQFQVSPDNHYIAFMVDTVGDRNYTMYIKDLNTGKFIEKSKKMVSNDGFFWGNDSKTLYYIQNDSIQRGHRAMKHTLNLGFENDKILYEEKDNTFWLYMTKSRSRKYIFITSESYSGTEVAYLDADNPNDDDRHLMFQRQKGLVYYANHFQKDSFYIYNNYQASNFKVSRSTIKPQNPDKWVDVIPHNDSSMLTKYEILEDYIIYQNRINGLVNINILDKKKNVISKVDFGNEPYNADFYVADFDNFKLDSFRFDYQSLKMPFSTYRYDITTHKKKLITQNIIEHYFPDSYVTKRLEVPSRDGVKIPVSIVYKKGKYSQKGQKPLVLTVYGAYGVNYETEFSPEIISLLDRGVAFAIAHVRGGQELGHNWYVEGKALKKKNSFNDFIDCAEYLIKNKYVAKDKLCAEGISSGGVVVCVAANERPDLFRVITPELPWTDAVSDAFDDKLPLTTQEWEEWGNAQTEESYKYMLSWSPYDNIKKMAYPAVLTTSAYHDTQVPFYSPTKWVLKLRDNNTGSRPIIHRCMLEAGHTGPSGRYERFKEIAVKYAFILTELGIKS